MCPVKKFTGSYNMPSFLDCYPGIDPWDIDNYSRMHWSLIFRHLNKKYNFHDKHFFKYMSTFLIKSNIYVYGIDANYYNKLGGLNYGAIITFHNFNHPENEHINSGECSCIQCDDSYREYF